MESFVVSIKKKKTCCNIKSLQLRRTVGAGRSDLETRAENVLHPKIKRTKKFKIFIDENFYHEIKIIEQFHWFKSIKNYLKIFIVKDDIINLFRSVIL